jgi:hypothetical protein
MSFRRSTSFLTLGGAFNLLNTANIVLIPKKDQAKSIGDYRPISLVHSVTKFS